MFMVFHILIYVIKSIWPFGKRKDLDFDLDLNFDKDEFYDDILAFHDEYLERIQHDGFYKDESDEPGPIPGKQDRQPRDRDMMTKAKAAFMYAN